MELKFRQTYFYMLPPDSSNCTFMELKYVRAELRKDAEEF